MTRTEWHFSAKDGNGLDTSNVYLNDMLLKFSGAAAKNSRVPDVSVPDLVPLGRSSRNHPSTPVTMFARTIAFVVIE
jgi:hypothetical protein